MEMTRALPFLVLLGLSLGACSGEEGGPGASMTSGPTAGSPSSEDFCGPVLARVDSFMATFQDDRWPEDRYGGTGVVGISAEVESLNALVSGDTGGVQHQMFVNLMTLLQYDEHLEAIPYLARSWDLSDDGTQLTFHLRDDVVWHDGEPTTAYDVAFTFLAATDPRTGFQNPSFFRHYQSGAEGVEVLDSLTVRFHMTPHAEPLDPWRTVAIMPEHLLGDVPPEDLVSHPFGAVCPVGNGPFRFVSHTPGDRWVFQANPAFPQELGGRPFLDRYVVRVIPEHTTLLAELLTGGIDVYVAMPYSQVSVVEEEPGVRVESFLYRSFLFVAWNSRTDKLADLRVRRALTLGINRRRIMTGIRGSDAILANTGVPPFHWAYEPELADSLAYDPEAARGLLDDAGWRDRDGNGVRENSQGEPLHLQLLTTENSEWRSVAEIIQAQLADIGVEVDLRVLEFTAALDVITSPAKEFEALLIAFDAEFRLDERDLFHSQAFEGPYAFSGTRDAQLDQYLDTLQSILTREQALPVWRDYQERILELQPFTFLYWAKRYDGVGDRLRGVSMDIRGEWAGIRDWWIAPRDRRSP